MQITTDCTNCISTYRGAFVLRLGATTDFLAFLTTHGINPFSPTPDFRRVAIDYEEDLLSVDPFRANFTFTIDDDARTLTVDDDLNVIDITETDPG